ncbi:unnamed protein product, partial [Didymodactylos carnosus]
MFDVITYIEHLPNELWFEYFEYLDGYDILMSFRNLNRRINDIINNTQLHINLSILSKSMFDRLLNRFIPYISKTQIILLKLSNKNNCEQISLFNSIINIKKFINLQTLILHDIKFYELDEWLYSLLELKSLKSLTIVVKTRKCFNQKDKNIGEKLNHILFNNYFTELKYLQLDGFEIDHENVLHDVMNECNLEYLILDKCQFNYLLLILNHLPKIKYLKIKSLTGRLFRSPHVTKNFVSCLIHLQLDDCTSIWFSQLEYLFKYIPYLKYLTFTSFNSHFINGAEWERLLRQYFPNLKNFSLHIQATDNKPFDIEKLSCPFKSSYFIDEKQWYFTFGTGQYIIFHLLSIYSIPYQDKTYKLDNNLLKSLKTNEPFLT